MNVTRRVLLRAALAAGAAGPGVALSRLGQLAAATTPTEDYRALVCVFLLGGNDSNNLIVPLDSAKLTLYTNTRKNLALPSTGTGALLPVQAASGAPFGFHPNMPEVQSLFNDKLLAVVANVGTLIRPVTRAQFLNSSSGMPANLFSHSDQQAAWESSVAQGMATSGWGGRLADQMAGYNTSNYPTLVSVSGNNLFCVGQQTRPGSVTPGAALGLQGYTASSSLPRLNAVQELLTVDTGATLVQQANLTLKQGMDNASALASALSGAPALTTTFPANNRLASQLQQIAKIIGVRRQLGMKRQIFFASIGSFDTHTNQLTDQGNLLTQLSQALKAFSLATQELGVDGNVTTFTESDFSRTFQPNTNGGTDHAWGSHQLVMGAAVRGGDVFGRFPSLGLGADDDAGSEGRWIPALATDQYAATLAAWFGLGSQQLPSVLPNIANFSTTNLGFLG